MRSEREPGRGAATSWVEEPVVDLVPEPSPRRLVAQDRIDLEFGRDDGVHDGVDAIRYGPFHKVVSLGR
jgi:hypothetical protein